MSQSRSDVRGERGGRRQAASRIYARLPTLHEASSALRFLSLLILSDTFSCVRDNPAGPASRLAA